jgi:hypothetical protein
MKGLLEAVIFNSPHPDHSGRKIEEYERLMCAAPTWCQTSEQPGGSDNPREYGNPRIPIMELLIYTCLPCTYKSAKKQ